MLWICGTYALFIDCPEEFVALAMMVRKLLEFYDN